MDILKGHLLEWGRLLTKHIRRGGGAGVLIGRRALKRITKVTLVRGGRGAGMRKLGGKNRSVQSNPVKDEP